MKFLTWCVQNKEKNDEEIIPEDPQPQELQFKSFHETYEIITFAMCLGVLYPNPDTDLFRLICTAFFFGSVLPVASSIFIDMYFCWLRKDFIEIIRHCTIVGPFLGIFLKILLMLHKRKSAKRIIDEINRDYSMYNDYPDDYKRLIQTHINNSLQYSQKMWAVIVVGTVSTFPIMAAVLNIHSALFTSDNKKYMIHDLNRPFSEPEARFESPYFEIMFAYMVYSAMFYIVNFLGYDGFYGLVINHACLKFELYCKRIEHAMTMGTKRDIMKRMIEGIQEQNRAFQFANNIQDTFNIWLGIIFMATIIEICNLMYHFSMGQGFDIRYAIFIIGAVIHVYLPCHYSSKLKVVAAETASLVYSSGWENVQDQSIRKMVVFMIARGQVPLEMTGFNMIRFDMELFVSIMQTSYSMYTLLRP